MILAGNPDRWWNYKLPMRKIAIAIAATLALLLAWVTCGGIATDVSWDIVHHRTAALRGQTLQVPWFWREADWGYYELDLVHDHIGLIAAPSQVMVSYDPDLDPQSVPFRIKQEHAVSERLAGKLSFHIYDASIDPHYACVAMGFERDRVASLHCYSLKGHWIATLLVGSNADLPAFRQILTGVAAMGTPAK